MKFFNVILALAALADTSIAWGGDYHLLDLEHFDMKAAQFQDNRDPYAPEYTKEWTYRVELNCRFSLLGFIYFDQHPHFEAVQATPKTVGWQWELGLHLTDQIDLFKDHHSRHVMEDYRPTLDGHNQFPVEDLYGVKFTIVDKPGTKNSISSFIFGD